MTDIPILTYHYFGKDKSSQVGIKAEDSDYITLHENFGSHIRFLIEQGYEAISFNQLFKSKNNQANLPAKPMILTFDDGHISLYKYAFPVMQEHNCSGEVFVITDKVGSPGYMNWSQLGELSEKRLSVQSHTKSHVLLNKLSKSEIIQELAESKKAIEDHLDRDVISLAVPMGGYPTSLKMLAMENDYKIICTSYYGINNLESNFFRLKRIMIKSPNDRVVDLLNLLKRNSYLAFKMRMKNWGKYLKNNILGVLL